MANGGSASPVVRESCSTAHRPRSSPSSSRALPRGCPSASSHPHSASHIAGVERVRHRRCRPAPHVTRTRSGCSASALHPCRPCRSPALAGRCQCLRDLACTWHRSARDSAAAGDPVVVVVRHRPRHLRHMDHVQVSWCCRWLFAVCIASVRVAARSHQINTCFGLPEAGAPGCSPCQPRPRSSPSP